MTKLCKKCSKETYANSTLCYDHLFLKKKEQQEAYNKKAIAKMKLKAKERKVKEKAKKEKKKEKKANSYKVVSKKAWNTFARWLKISQMSFQGYFTCYTCGKTLPIAEAQAGHCFHRGRQNYRAIDFDPKHIRLQCGGCNCFSTGQTNIFQAKLTRELGIEEVEKMIWRRANEPALTIEELKDLINKYELHNN